MIFICDKPGQLGNRLFIFAHFIAFAKENNLTVSNLAFDEYAPFFDSVRNDLLCRFPLKKTLLKNKILRRILYWHYHISARVIIRLKINNKFISGKQIEMHTHPDYKMESKNLLHEATQTKCFLYCGWGFRNEHLFIKHAEFIRNFFTPLSYYLQQIEKKFNLAKKEDELLIGVHIRHGDYQTHEAGKYFYSIEQYKHKMRETEKLFIDKKIKFFISSDEKSDEKNFSSFNCVFNSQHFLMDLYSLAKCDFIIGPPSTYSMWASFYGKVPLLIIYHPDEPIKMEQFSVYYG